MLGRGDREAVACSPVASDATFQRSRDALSARRGLASRDGSSPPPSCTHSAHHSYGPLSVIPSGSPPVRSLSTD